MKKQFTKYNGFLIMAAALMILTFAFSLAAQTADDSLPPLAEDTSINPHDFNNEYYAANGVEPKLIIGRRTGTDFLSVFGLSSNPIHNNVRILATLPAYSETGEIRFWNPLGEVTTEGFTQTEAGAQARQIAGLYPIYVFPRNDADKPFSFTNNRQAAIIPETPNYMSTVDYSNPLGLRLILMVNYTDKALITKEGLQMMNYMGKKNGFSLEDTPLIKTAGDIEMLATGEFITIERLPFYGDAKYGVQYAITPVMATVVKGVIAHDAFLNTVLRDGRPLTGEAFFSEQFGCLLKYGDWCN